MALPFRAVASPLRGKEKKKYAAFLTAEHLVGAAALRPPLAALPLTAAAYPLRVFGSPFPRNLALIRLERQRFPACQLVQCHAVEVGQLNQNRGRGVP